MLLNKGFDWRHFFCKSIKRNRKRSLIRPKNEYKLALDVLFSNHLCELFYFSAHQFIQCIELHIDARI